VQWAIVDRPPEVAERAALTLAEAMLEAQLDTSSAMMSFVLDRTRGHRALPHTADVILEAWGPDLASCCEEAVSALTEVCVDAGTAGVVDRRRFHARPGSPESLVLDVLEEVIFTLDTAEAVPVRAVVAVAGDGGLDVDLVLAAREDVTATGAVPKAVSRSLELEARPGTVVCRFLVDV
jgi:SHS2 domain-containing protein